MFIEWRKSLEIGDSVVDSEHRYLVQLINNLHDQHASGSSDSNLTNVFTHLASYVKNHFENEEALMLAISYPEFEGHKKEHQKLVEQCMKLAEEYLDGSESITEATLDFLKHWAVNHISETDMKIRGFLGGTLPPKLSRIPAYASSSGTDFKQCTLCGKVWHSFDDLKDDKTKKLLGCQLDETNHLYNLLMFNCTCGTTLAMFIKEFVPQTDIPFIIEDHTDRNQRPAYCMKKEADGPCLSKCACEYTHQIMEALG
jgi:hemerythrin-like metal-binding protein